MEAEGLDLIESCQFSIGDAHYAAYPGSHGFIPQVPEKSGLVTVIHLEAYPSRAVNAVLDYVDNALRRDDVFKLNFLKGIIFYGNLPEQGSLVNEGLAAHNFPAAWNTSWTCFIGKEVASDSEPEILPGPYLLRHDRLWDVYRLYEDDINAFLVAFKPRFLPTPADKPTRLSVQGHQNYYKSIAVPSRLLATSKTKKDAPLSGVRITVKDMFDIEGFQTSLGSRAYRELYPPATRTAPAIQKLIDKGAVLIGLSQLCSMVGTTEPTQCIDFQAPFNPRGDGYQSPSGGSSGQPSAVAAYEWLDCAIGTDSTISGRMPAQVNGCFSMRPSCGMISTEGMWSGAPQFDTPCIFSRDIFDFERIVPAWYGEKLRQTNETKQQDYSLIHLTDSIPQNRAQMDLFDKFAQDMESFLSTNVQNISIKELWNQKPPVEAAGNTLEEWLHKDVATRSYIFFFWKKIESFYNDYKNKFEKEPFMPPPHGIDLWKPAKGVTPEQHADAIYRVQVYRDWLREKLFPVENQRVIAIMPLRERERQTNTRFTADVKAGQHLWEPLLLSPILSAPEIVVPIGQIPYLSRISGNVEYLPVCCSVMGLPRSDLHLIDFVQKFLKQVGRPTKVLTGKTMFKVD